MNKDDLKRKFPGIAKDVSDMKRYLGYEYRKHSTPEQKRKILENTYLERIGVPLNLNAPKRYTEKIQWMKLYGVTPLMSLLSDKYRVRDWVKQTIGEEYLLPMITAVKSFDEIDFKSLPDKFVIKSNHSSGWNIIVKDKEKLDLKQVKKKMDFWQHTNYAYWSMLEMQYASIPTVFVIEDYITDHNDELNDYKFLCFDGVPYFCWVDTGRFSHHTRTVYDMDWNRQPWSQVYNPEEVYIDKPQNFDEMKKLATALCKGFRHVRVDLYNVDGKIYFGEMTFTNGNGFDKIVPDKYDEVLGSYFHIGEKHR